MITLKNYIKKKLIKFPLLNFIILYFFRRLNLSARALNSDFPINNKSEILGYKNPFLKKKKDEGFFLRFYPTSNNNLFFLNKFYSLVRNHLFAYEILWAQKKKFVKIDYKFSKKKLIAISHFSKKLQKFKIYEDNKKYQIELEPEKYSYLNFNTKKIKIKSNQDFIISTKFLKKKISEKNKLVVAIFVDGLSNFNNFSLFKKYAPETYNFFKKGIIYQNHFSNAEWTVPSSATIMTGKNTSNHGIFHPQANHDISKKNKLLAEYFRENDYLTFMCNSGWRTSPGYGYLKGFDRTIYKKEADANDLINKSLDHLNSFKSYNNFMFLGLNDLHHDLNLVPPLDLQVNLDPSFLYKERITENTKSVYQTYNKNKIEILKNNTRSLDKKLSIFYNFLEKNYKKNFLISIFTDHGHSFFDNNKYILSHSRISIPFMIRGNNSLNDKKYNNKIISSNVDILPTLLGASGIKTKNLKLDGLNLLQKNLKKLNNRKVLIESIYPNKKYEAKLITNQGADYIFNIDNITDNNGKITIKNKIDKINSNDKEILKKIKIWNKYYQLNKNSF